MTSEFRFRNKTILVSKTGRLLFASDQEYKQHMSRKKHEQTCKKNKEKRKKCK